jgi:RNA polymerase sigma factor (TIGR02999 family)
VADGEITQLIAAWLRGDKAAENALFDALYRQLHHRALQLLRGEPAGRSMGPTALVHEAYLRLERAEALEVGNREHFLRLAAKVMHRILVDRARARLSAKRGGDLVRVDEFEHLIRTDADADEILAVDTALTKLKEQSPRQAQVVELRYFAGYSLEETAMVLGVAERTVKRDWNVARVRLKIAIAG